MVDLSRKQGTSQDRLTFSQENQTMKCRLDRSPHDLINFLSGCTRKSDSILMPMATRFIAKQQLAHYWPLVVTSDVVGSACQRILPGLIKKAWLKWPAILILTSYTHGSQSFQNHGLRLVWNVPPPSRHDVGWMCPHGSHQSISTLKRSATWNEMGAECSKPGPASGS